MTSLKRLLFFIAFTWLLLSFVPSAKIESVAEGKLRYKVMVIDAAKLNTYLSNNSIQALYLLFDYDAVSLAKDQLALKAIARGVDINYKNVEGQESFLSPATEKGIRKGLKIGKEKTFSLYQIDLAHLRQLLADNPTEIRLTPEPSKSYPGYVSYHITRFSGRTPLPPLPAANSQNAGSLLMHAALAKGVFMSRLFQRLMLNPSPPAPPNFSLE